MAQGIMEQLIEALKENTEALRASGDGKAPAKAGSKPADKAPPKEEKKTDPKEAAKIVTDYLKAGDASAREDAKANVAKIVEHFGADRFTTITDLDKALAMLEQFKNGDTPDELASGDDDGESLV